MSADRIPLAPAGEGDEARAATILALLETVCDPEIPVLSLTDLGVLREVRVQGGRISVVITPTYSGCPAMHAMEQAVREALDAGGYEGADIVTRLAPAWTTDWMSEEGRRKLRDYGISPPQRSEERRTVECPQCGSANTSRISEFGSTACKALYRCEDCREPFDHFKCI